MRWKIVSRVAKRTHEQFRVEVYLRVGVQTRRARFTPHRFVRDNLRRANEREREREREKQKKREKKHVRIPASFAGERTREKQAASPASPDSARAYYNETIDLENQSVPFTKTDPKAKSMSRRSTRATQQNSSRSDGTTIAK